MQGYDEVYFCTTVASKVEVHMAYCEDATCAKCGTPFPNMYGYVDGECNRDFLKAACSATKALDGLEGVNDDQTRGIDIIRRAIEAPVRQIAENAGVEYEEDYGRVTKESNRRVNEWLFRHMDG